MKCPLCHADIAGRNMSVAFHLCWGYHGVLQQTLLKVEGSVVRCMCGHSYGFHDFWSTVDPLLLEHIATCQQFQEAVMLYHISGGLCAGSTP